MTQFLSFEFQRLALSKSGVVHSYHFYKIQTEIFALFMYILFSVFLAFQ